MSSTTGVSRPPGISPPPIDALNWDRTTECSNSRLESLITL